MHVVDCFHDQLNISAPVRSSSIAQSTTCMLYTREFNPFSIVPLVMHNNNTDLRLLELWPTQFAGGIHSVPCTCVVLMS